MPADPVSFDPPPTAHALDARALARHARRAAATGEAHTQLAREVASRMQERLSLVRLTPTRVLDLGCGAGADLEPLALRFPGARVLALDDSDAMLARIPRPRGLLGRLIGRRAAPDRLRADARSLPLASGSVGMVWSNFLLPAVDDPLALFREAFRVLEVGGLLMFATLGPDTLRELREAFAEADRWPHVHPMPDMHDLGDALVACGFADPVMDMELLTLTYTQLDDLFADLRGSGAGLALAGRRRGLMSRAAWARMQAAYEARRKEGRLPASFEVVYGHAWKAERRMTDDGAAIVRFDLPRHRQRRV